MKKEIILIYFLLIGVCACNNSIESGIIIGSNQKIAFDSSIDSIQLLPLGIKDEFIIGEINKIIQVDSFYYILDSWKANSLYAFNDQGVPLAKFGSIGRGPEEYLFIYDIDIDVKNKKLVILCQPQKIFITDLNFNIEKTIYLQENAERLVSYHDEIYLYSHEDRSLKILIGNEGEAKKIITEKNVPQITFRALPIFHKIDQMLFYNAIGSDIIYKVIGNKVEKITKINYKNKKQKMEKMNSHDLLSTRDALLCSPPAVHTIYRQQNHIVIIYTYEALIRICHLELNFSKLLNDGILVFENSNLMTSVNSNQLYSWTFLRNNEIPFNFSNLKVSFRSPLYISEEVNPVLMNLFLKH